METRASSSDPFGPRPLWACEMVRNTSFLLLVGDWELFGPPEYNQTEAANLLHLKAVFLPLPDRTEPRYW